MAQLKPQREGKVARENINGIDDTKKTAKKNKKILNLLKIYLSGKHDVKPYDVGTHNKVNIALWMLR